MKRIPRQAMLPFGRSERSVNRQIAERMAGKKARDIKRGPGRPRKPVGAKKIVPHTPRPSLGTNSAVHVTLKLRRHVPNLRNRKKYALVKKAFSRFRFVSRSCPRVGAPGDVVRVEHGFRLVHYAVLGDHVHMLCEADSARWLARGVQKLAISLARLLNAAGVREAGGSLDPRAGSFRERAGWIGKIFAERYHLHALATPTEIAACLDYLFTNASKHFAGINAVRCKITLATGTTRYLDIDGFTSFAELHTSADPPMAPPRGTLLRKELRKTPWASGDAASRRANPSRRPNSYRRARH
ncbi:MAG: hypothetical protein IT381_27350 [Deltaproteobacteria bacterium]|nr:hypothetical protein [Deltaproteobacteria bacterium]